MEATPLPTTGHQARKAVTMTSTTTQAIDFTGWTLPAGTTVTVEKVCFPKFGQQVSHANCKAPEFSQYGFAVPVYAIDSVEGVPVYSFNEATGREELVKA